MDIEEFLLDLLESEECKAITYKCQSICEYMGLYYENKPVQWEIDNFMIPFRNEINKRLADQQINIDELAKYMISTDKSNCALYAFSTRFQRKEDLTELQYLGAIARNQIITPFVNQVDMDTYALIVESYIFDNLVPQIVQIRDIVGHEIFAYETNQYNLTKINGAIFKKDGMIFAGKGYYYNLYTNKELLGCHDTMPAFARIITDYGSDFDILYRLDERLSMPENEYRDYSRVKFQKFYGPQFRFDGSTLKEFKTLIVHMNPDNMAKLLMVVKRNVETDIEDEFWHIEIETLPYPKQNHTGDFVTTFLHGMYHPEKKIFSHIDYTKNVYDNCLYREKYQDSQNGASIDSYTENRSLHYKIWCIENGEFSIDMWYRLIVVSLTKQYQALFEEMMR